MFSAGDGGDLSAMLSGMGKKSSGSGAVKTRSLKKPYKAAGLRLLKQAIESVQAEAECVRCWCKGCGRAIA